MSRSAVAQPRLIADLLQGRVHALGREALEGGRPLSDLLGDAFAELRTALGRVRELESELYASERTLSRLRAEFERGTAVAAPGVADAAAVGQGGASAATPPAPQDGPARPDPPADLLEADVPAVPEALESELRARIAGALYLGSLGAGDPLPGIRELARRTGLNHKVVRRVYRSMEAAGLVEVRDRSGIYVADSVPTAAPREPMAAWAATVLVQATGFGVGAAALLTLLQQAVGARRLRCACVDDMEDDRFALCAEIEALFAMRTIPREIVAGAPAGDPGDADLVVTTPFHVDRVRRALAPGQPLLVARLHPRWRQTVEAHSGGKPLRLVCVEGAAGERLRRSLGPRLARRLRVVPLATLDPEDDTPGLATGAAWARMGWRGPPPQLARPEYLSPRSVRDLADALVALNGVPAPAPTR